MSEQPKNLYQKISAVMQDIQYLQKDDKVSTGASGSYKAMSEEKVTQVVRESLIAHGLVILPVSQSHSRDELRDKEGVLKSYLSIVDTQYKIVDIETGQYETLASSGTGADTQDKGVGKAMTYSYKYLLLRTFAIPTGEDPDKVSSATMDEQHEKDKQKAAQEDENVFTQVKIKWQTLAGNLDGFDDWHTKNKNNGVTNAAMNQLLAKKLLDKKEAQPA
jgi:hypothetical protein